MCSNSTVCIPGIGSFTKDEVDVITSKIFSLVSGCSLDSSGKLVPSEITKCSRCNSTNIVKYGFSNGKQRYQCKNCKKLFGETTLEIICNSHISSNIWKVYIQSFISGASLTESAKVCDVSISTSLSLRHKILNTIHTDFINRHPDFKFAIDENIFPVSLKGNQPFNIESSFGRKARRRGLKRKIDYLEGEEKDLWNFICCQYNGVSTKYLKLYVGWYMWLKEFKESKTCVAT